MVSQKGFTLIELLLYIAIAGMVIFGFVSFFQMILEAQVKNRTVTTVHQEGAQIANLISQTIRNASGVNAPAAGASGASLSLAVPDGALSPTVIDQSGGTLRMSEGGGAAVNLNSSRTAVSDLVVENLTRSGTPGTVRISFTLTHINPGNRAEYSFSRTFYFSASLRR